MSALEKFYRKHENKRARKVQPEIRRGMRRKVQRRAEAIARISSLEDIYPWQSALKRWDVRVLVFGIFKQAAIDANAVATGDLSLAAVHERDREVWAPPLVLAELEAWLESDQFYNLCSGFGYDSRAVAQNMRWIMYECKEVIAPRPTGYNRGEATERGAPVEALAQKCG